MDEAAALSMRPTESKSAMNGTEILAAEVGVLLRAMDAPHPGQSLGAVLALQRILSIKGHTLSDLAAWIEAWAAFDAQVRADAEPIADAYDRSIDPTDEPPLPPGPAKI